MGFSASQLPESDPIIKFDEKNGQGTVYDWTGQRRENPSSWDVYFPSKALRTITPASTTSTVDLLPWLIWSNDPERNYEFISRFFGWLLGPLLLFALLAHTLPDPKAGRTRALGIILFQACYFWYQLNHSGSYADWRNTCLVGSSCAFGLFIRYWPN